MPDVFISYSRKDRPFVERLTRALEANGRDVWVDFDDIPFAAEWWDEICEGIESSEVVVFILSPDSVASEVCGLELNHVFKHNKRLIPILYRPLDRKDVPAKVAELNWIDFQEQAVFEQAISQLLTTMDTDLEVVRQRTRLLLRARDWERQGHSSSILLRGAELYELQKLTGDSHLTDLQQRYLAESVESNLRRQTLNRFLWGFVGGLLGIGFWAFSTIRSPLGTDSLVTPQRLIYTLSLGQAFGLCLGLMAALAGELPESLQRRLPKRSVFRVLICIILGVLAWAGYLWFIEILFFTPPDINALLLGGVGLAAGLVLRFLFDLPSWLSFLLTAILAYIPMYITLEEFLAGTGRFVSLVFFDNPRQIFSVGIPMAILFALGANAPFLREAARALQRLFQVGGNQLRTLFRELTAREAA